MMVTGLAEMTGAGTRRRLRPGIRTYIHNIHNIHNIYIYMHMYTDVCVYIYIYIYIYVYRELLDLLDTPNLPTKLTPAKNPWLDNYYYYYYFCYYYYYCYCYYYYLPNYNILGTLGSTIMGSPLRT